MLGKQQLQKPYSLIFGNERSSFSFPARDDSMRSLNCRRSRWCLLAATSLLGLLCCLPEMRARLLGMLLSPAAQLVRLLATPAGQLARVLKAHEEKEAGGK